MISRLAGRKIAPPSPPGPGDPPSGKVARKTRRAFAASAILLALTLLATPALAVRPDEMLPDPALEARARDLSQGLRCLVCRNESIDDSDADLAHDLRVLLRQRLTAGDTDQQAVGYIVARYGEFVLLNPSTTGANLILWLAGPAALLAGGVLAFVVTRRRAAAPDVAGLSAEDQARLADLLKE